MNTALENQLDSARNAAQYWRREYARGHKEWEQWRSYQDVLKEIQSMRCLNDECTDQAYREIQELILQHTGLPITGKRGEVERHDQA